MKNPLSFFNNTAAQFRMMPVKGGTFDMGGESWGNNAKPIHAVELSDFWMGEHLVTQAVWEHIMGVENNPSRFKGKNRPVESVSWEDIVNNFLPQLNQMTQKERPKDTVFCLPTEAQWEYAARGGIHWKDNFRYAGGDKLNEVAWYDDNSHNETKPVGLKLQNQLGIYDMSGNVWEWCSDVYGSYTDVITNSVKNSNGDAIVNPIGITTKGGLPVYRGGSWNGYAGLCRPTSRSSLTPSIRHNNLGFRLVLFSFSV